MYSKIVYSSHNNLDVDMEVGAELVLPLNRVAAGRPDVQAWRLHPYVTRGSEWSHTLPVRLSFEDPDILTIEAVSPGIWSTWLFAKTNNVWREGDRYYVSGEVVHHLPEVRTHPGRASFAEHRHNPLATGFLLVGDKPKARHPVPCQWNVKLGPGDDGEGEAILHTGRYVRPGEQFLFPDDHLGTIRSVQPVYLRATGERIESHISVFGIEAREAPASACIADPPSRVETGTQVLLHPCTVTLGADYEWAAYDEKGNAVGTWTRSNAANGVWNAPNDPGIVHITLSTTLDGHEHVSGAQVWVEPPESDYAPVPIPQPVQPGDPANRKRYQVDVRYEGMSIELSGTDITFRTGEGLPITATVERLPVGPFDFYAEGPTGMNGRMEVTLHGVVHVSLFTL